MPPASRQSDMAHSLVVKPTDRCRLSIEEMVRPSLITDRIGGAAGAVRLRLRGRMLAIIQTAAAAVVAWELAVLLLPDPRPAFAAIAAVIAVGATNGERVGRAFQLVTGVVIGITVATLMLSVIGTGAWQMGVLVILAMGSSIALGLPELVVVEAGVSAILIVALDPRAAARVLPHPNPPGP